jgi:hypothetical protein
MAAAIDNTVDQVFQEWDDHKLRLHSTPAQTQAEKYGAWAKLITQRQTLFVERWRPERMKVLKKLGGKTEGTDTAKIKGTLTPLAREEFIHDLRTWGVPDKYAVAAGPLIEVK